MPLKETDRRDVQDIVGYCTFGKTVGSIKKYLVISYYRARKLVDAMVEGKVLHRFEMEQYTGGRMQVLYRVNPWVDDDEVQRLVEALLGGRSE